MKRKTVYIIGNRGNMARRYAAILRYLGHFVLGHDEGVSAHPRLYENADCFIVATPTETHLRIMEELIKLGKPIISEKAFTTDLKKLNEFEDKNRQNLNLISMVNQYSFLIDSDNDGETYWDYWNSGKDGLAWDCINIIGLSKSKPHLSNNSPTWECKINGKKLFLSHMDGAYIRMLESWLRNPLSNYHYAKVAHEKTQRFIDGKW